MSLGYYGCVFGGVLVVGTLATIGSDPENGGNHVSDGCAWSLILATLTVVITFAVDLAGGLP